MKKNRPLAYHFWTEEAIDYRVETLYNPGVLPQNEPWEIFMANAAAKTELNALCERCVRTCRQPKTVVLCECKRFTPFPFPIASAPSEQLGLFGQDPELDD